MVTQPFDKTITIHTDMRRGRIRVYKRDFKFLPPSSDASPKEVAASKLKAEQEAIAWGREVLASLEKRLGRPLTRREIVWGQEVMPEEKMSGSLKPEDDDRNPHDSRVQFLSSRFCRTENDKKHNQALLDLALKRQAAWAEARAYSIRQAEVDSDPEIQRARAHAESYGQKLMIEGTSEQIREHELRTQAINSIDGRSGVYWQSLGRKEVPPDALPPARTMLAEHVE